MGNIIITEKQLERLTNRVKNSINENQEEGSYMSKKQLHTIAKLAYLMWKKMEDGEQLENWMESKIAQAEQSVISVVNEFMYPKGTSSDGQRKDFDGTKDIDFDEIIIGN
jgi:hypothetical protein